MTAIHILTLAVFVFMGAAGLAAIQESLAVCFRTVFPRKGDSPKASQYSQSGVRLLMTR